MRWLRGDGGARNTQKGEKEGEEEDWDESMRMRKKRKKTRWEV